VNASGMELTRNIKQRMLLFWYLDRFSSHSAMLGRVLAIRDVSVCLSVCLSVTDGQTDRQQLGLYSKCYTVCDFTLQLKSFKVETAKPLLSVLRTGKPNWRGVQLFRRTNRKMTNVQLLAFFTLQPLSLAFTSHSIAILEDATEHF